MAALPGPTRAAVCWFVLSGVVTSWHVLFVLLRPRSLPGGDLSGLFPGYHLFLSIGRAYADVTDPLITALAWCNAGEVALGLVAAVLMLLGRPLGSVLGLLAATMSFWKTVLCVLLPSPLCSAQPFLSNTTWKDFVLYYALPISPWLLVTGWLILQYSLALSLSISKLNKIAAKGKMPRDKAD